MLTALVTLDHTTAVSFRILALAVMVALALGAVAAVADVAPPSNVTLPTVQSDGVVGDPLSFTPGTWAGDVTGVVDYWEACSGETSSCSIVAGPGAPTYVAAGDACTEVTVVEYATGANGVAVPAFASPIGLTAAPASGRRARYTPGPPPCWVNAFVAFMAAKVTAEYAAEQEEAAAAQTPPAPMPPTTTTLPSAPDLAGKTRAALAAAIRTRRLPLDIHHVLVHSSLVSFSAPATGRATIDWYAADPGSRRFVTIARGTENFTAVVRGSIAVRATAAGRVLLKHAKRLHVVEVGTFTPTDGAPISAQASLELVRSG